MSTMDAITGSPAHVAVPGEADHNIFVGVATVDKPIDETKSFRWALAKALTGPRDARVWPWIATNDHDKGHLSEAATRRALRCNFDKEARYRLALTEIAALRSWYNSDDWAAMRRTLVLIRSQREDFDSETALDQLRSFR